MKTYIVYDEKGNERGYIKSASHNSAEKKAKKLYGLNASVAYTELWKHPYSFLWLTVRGARYG